jgi:hypothetical protein
MNPPREMEQRLYIPDTVFIKQQGAVELCHAIFLSGYCPSLVPEMLGSKAGSVSSRSHAPRSRFRLGKRVQNLLLV